MSAVGFSPLFQRPIRQDPWPDLGAGTIHLVRRRLAAGEGDAAVELLRYAEFEYRTVREIYARWNRDMVDYLAARMPDATVERVFQRSLQPWVHVLFQRPAPLALTMQGDEARLHDADGTVALRVVPAEDHRYVLAFGPGPVVDEVAAARLDEAAEAMRRGDDATVAALLDEHVRSSRLAHDVLADWAWALLSLGHRTLGEERLEEMQRVTLHRCLAHRYRLLAQMSAAEMAQLTVEGMRGHFSGPGRQGDVEVVEEEDRWVLSFDPCGSGGRMRRGDALNGTPSRYDPPFNFTSVEGAYPWTWGEKGVCLYCSHCSFVNEILPIEHLGYPMRVTENPRDPGDKCRWIVYKRPELVPEEAYRRVGKEKPARFRSEG